MTKEEAWRIIDANTGWNILYAPAGMSEIEKDVVTNRKLALAAAWAVVGELTAKEPR